MWLPESIQESVLMEPPCEDLIGLQEWSPETRCRRPFAFGNSLYSLRLLPLRDHLQEGGLP